MGGSRERCRRLEGGSIAAMRGTAKSIRNNFEVERIPSRGNREKVARLSFGGKGSD